MKGFNKVIEFENRIEQNSEEIFYQTSRFYIHISCGIMTLIVFLLVLFAMLFTKAAKHKTKQKKYD